MASTFKFRREVLKELGRDPDFRAIFREMGEAVADQAAINAPVDTGEYRASIDIDVIDRKAGIVARVSSSDPKAMWIEFGTGGGSPTPVFAPLRSALNSIVGRFEGTFVHNSRFRPRSRRRR